MGGCCEAPGTASREEGAVKKPVKSTKNSVKKNKAAVPAKGTGPSKRTPAQRAAIDKRAAADTKAKRTERAGIERALKVRCPSCHAQAGAPCFARDGRQVPTPHRLRMLALPAKGAVKFVMTSSAPPSAADDLDNRRFLPVAQHASPGVPTIAIDEHHHRQAAPERLSATFRSSPPRSTSAAG
jgi:hypothetical protein